MNDRPLSSGFPDDGWKQYFSLMLDQQNSLDRRMEALRKEVEDLRVAVTADIATLKLKASLWGAAAGLIPGIGVALFTLMRK